METLSIFLGDICAVIFAALVSFCWYVLKYPGFRVGANWTYLGWDVKKAGRLPNETDTGDMTFMPNLSVTSRDDSVKKVIYAVWVCERSDIHDHGEILGKLDLQSQSTPEARTTGGEQLRLTGPRIVYPAAKFQRVINCPVFIQTSDGDFYKAASPGNQPKGLAKLRYRVQDFVVALRRRISKALE